MWAFVRRQAHSDRTPQAHPAVPNPCFLYLLPVESSEGGPSGRMGPLGQAEVEEDRTVTRRAEQARSAWRGSFLRPCECTTLDTSDLGVAPDY